MYTIEMHNDHLIGCKIDLCINYCVILKCIFKTKNLMAAFADMSKLSPTDLKHMQIV